MPRFTRGLVNPETYLSPRLQRGLKLHVSALPQQFIELFVLDRAAPVAVDRPVEQVHVLDGPGELERLHRLAELFVVDLARSVHVEAAKEVHHAWHPALVNGAP